MPEIVAVEGRMDLANIADFHRRLLAVADQDVTIDLSRCPRLGALALQCCISALKTGRDRGTKVTIAPLPDDLRQHLSHMGLTEDDLQEIAHGD